VSRGGVCAFIAAEKTTYGVRRLCRVFAIQPDHVLRLGRPRRRPDRCRAGRCLRGQ
jgi:hypothetical protein